VNPIDVGGHPRVDIRPVGIWTGHGSEGHQSAQQIALVLEEHQRSSGVAVALLGTGQPTELGGLDIQLVAGVLLLALLDGGDGHRALPQPGRGSGLPSGHLGDQALQFIRSQLLVGQTNGTHKVVELGRSGQADEGNVIDLSLVGSRVPGMGQQLLDAYILVRRSTIRHLGVLMELAVRVRAGIPFSQANRCNLQIAGRRLGHTVGSSQHIAIADKHSSAGVDLLLVAWKRKGGY